MAKTAKTSDTTEPTEAPVTPLKPEKPGKDTGKKAEARARKVEKKAVKKAEKKTGKEKQDGKAAKPVAKTNSSRIKFESTLPRLEAVAYFEAIVSGLRKGAVKFKQGDDAISLSPAPHVDIEVKAERKKNREHVSFEIVWRTDEDADLTISAN